jgi:predicted amidophosphoribosyltransferase
MAAKNPLVDVHETQIHWPLVGASCKCLSAFFREEFVKHHQCLEAQREYFSERAIADAEDALRRVLAQLDQLCQRDDACSLIEELLKQLDSVTNLSAWTEPEQLH